MHNCNNLRKDNMRKKRENNKKSLFENFAIKLTKATGSTPAFICAFLLVVVWAATGPLFNYSETWQLVINTGTTIITFLMVFIIQKAQNKDSLAIQLKLNELVAAHELASNRLVDVEDLTEEEMEVIKKYYSKLSLLTKDEESLQQSHSIDEAEQQHNIKKEREKNLESHRKPPAKKEAVKSTATTHKTKKT